MNSWRLGGYPVLVGLVLVALLAACGAPAEPAKPPNPATTAPATATSSSPRAGGAITVAATSDAVNLHPYKTTDTASSSYQGLVYASGLVTRDPRNSQEYIGELAERWTLADDGVTYTFYLRPNLRWSDGQPLTAADFKWTYEQARLPENGFPYISRLDPIEAFETPDARTVVVRIKEPLVVGLDTADAIRPLPKHIWEHLDWNDSGKNPEIFSPSVASGPFKLQEWQRDSHAVFVANDMFYKGRPKLDRYSIQVVPNQAVAFEKLRLGEVDYTGFQPADYERAKRMDHVTVYEWWPAAASWSFMGFNLRKPALQDANLRRGLSHAIDREVIVDRVRYGLAGPTYSAFTPSCWCYNPDVPKYDYNAARARELLAQAGWTPGSEGYAVKDGERLRLRILYGPNSNKVREQIATVAQEEFRRIGVEAEVQGLEWSAFLQAIQSPPFDWDLVVLGWSSSEDPHWSNQVWRESSIPKLNFVGYVNKRVEELYELGAREFDSARRKRIYQDIQQAISNDAPYIFLTTDKAFVGINNRIGGIEPTPLGIGHNIEQWHVK